MMSRMKVWFKTFVPTSDPDNYRTPPLPLEELYRYPLSPEFSESSGSPNSDISSNGAPSPDNDDAPGPSRKRGRKRAAGVAMREHSRESSTDCPAKRTRTYKLRTDAQRQDPEYQRMRAQNREAVKKSREKNELKAAEEKRKNEEEKELYRSTIMKLLETYEWDSIVEEKQREGRIFFPPDRPANLGMMDPDHCTIYEGVRRQLEERIVYLARK